MSDDAGATSIKLFGIYTAARVVGFLGLAYFTRVLSKELLGIYFLFFLVVQVTSLVSNLGLTQALVTKVNEQERPDAVFSATLAVVTAVVLVITAAVYLFRTPLADYIGADVPLLIATATASWLVADIQKTGLEAEDRVLTSGLLQLTEDVLRVGVGGVLITIGFGPVGLMYGIIAGFAGSAVIGYLTTGLTVVLPRKEDFRRIFSVSRYTMVYGPTNFMYFWLDTYMIGLLIGPAAVSAYEVGWNTTRVLIIATSAISTTIFPKVSRWAAEEDFDEIERVIPGTVLFTLVFPVPGLVGLTVLGPEILTLVYTPEYLDAVIPMAILATYMVTEAVQRVCNPILTAIDAAHVPFRSRLIGVGVAIVLNVTLIPEIGLIGAAIATFAAKFVDTAIQWRSLFARLDVELPVRSVLWEFASAALMGLTVYGATLLHRPGSLLELFAYVGLGAGVYAALVTRDPEIKGVVEQYLPVDVPL